MVIEVHTRSKPAQAHRAWASAIALLMIVSGLAGAMTWRRTSRLLSDRVSPPGWGITFQPPEAFEQLDQPGLGYNTAYRYRLHGSGGASAELAVWRLQVEADVTATGVCDLVLRQIDISWLKSLFGMPPTRLEETLGGRRAIEIQDPAAQAIVRSVVLDDGVAYAISLKLVGAAIDQDVYRLFDLACRSVEFIEG